ncbi:hypothetical protein KFD70_21530 [Bacillus pfraonensis]|nr:hypothetical protein [Bacillus pseudomycoides]
MAKKIRLIRTMVIEYVPDPKHYEEGMTIEEMAKFDAESDDLESIFTELESDVVKWEIIDSEKA